LRRDLHDGLGPTLAGVSLEIESARSLVESDPAAAERLLAELKSQVQSAITDIRRIAHELRPPALDQLGLVGAVKQHADRLGASRNRAPSSNGMRVSVESRSDLPPLPAAVEVAAYRIALEALTNASRHADADRCTVRIAVNGGLELEVLDDGRGIPADASPGVGISSMRERAEELGGRLEVESPAGGGTVVSALLPELRVLIADDHPVFRRGLGSAIEGTDSLEVVGEAETGTDAIEQTLALQPDVVVMDLQMPERNGIEATREIVAQSPHVAVLVLTMFEDDDSVFAAMRAGARGYLLKGADHDEVVRAIRAVASGEAIFGPAIAERLMAYFAASADGTAQAFPELTGREREVLELIAQGRSNARIADELVLSQKTVRNHVSNIFTKLQVMDRAQAIVKAREAGMGRQ
jgi:DNA-binding NarL/FixJ family response regulator